MTTQCAGEAMKPEVRPVGRDVDLLALHALRPDRYPFLLQSTARAGRNGRFDILFAFPGDSLRLSTPGSLHAPWSASGGSFLAELDGWWRELVVPAAKSTLPFHGGWFLYLGYELAAEIEPALVLRADSLLPAAFAVRCRSAFVVDHVDGSVSFVFEPGADPDWQAIENDLADSSRLRVRPRRATPTVTEEPAGRFLAAVERAKEHIAAGNIYQANLSRAWTASFDSDPGAADVYSALSRANPGPFAGLARWEETSIVSSSPERLLEIRDGRASTRPIAGTRPRSSDPLADDSLSLDLFANAKERAEHVMLIDLERNDLGRFCVAGSVEVNEMMVLESYAHVHHIVSNVRGRIQAGTTPGTAIRAVFPGGTITGVPKVRCMQIIAELEQTARGAYTGSMGYLNRDGSMDLNILIRTMVVNGNRVTLRAGSGIVADSDPAAELAETRAKAKGLLEALTSE